MIELVAFISMFQITIYACCHSTIPLICCPFLAPKIHTFSTRRNDVLCPRSVLVCVSEMLCEPHKVFSDVFNCLLVSAIVDKKRLCIHRGLSPEMERLH